MVPTLFVDDEREPITPRSRFVYIALRYNTIPIVLRVNPVMEYSMRLPVTLIVVLLMEILSWFCYTFITLFFNSYAIPRSLYTLKDPHFKIGSQYEIASQQRHRSFKIVRLDCVAYFFE